MMENDPEFSVSNGIGILIERHFLSVENLVLAIPANYHWNGSNIPVWLQWLFGIPFDQVHAIPSLDHDRLYEVGAEYGITRREADRKYRNDIMARGQNTILAWIEWLNIRLFGWRYWEVENKEMKK